MTHQNASLFANFLCLEMLNPDDRSLSFITEREKDESRLNIRAPMKHIAVFRAVRGDHFVCYDG